MMKYIVILNRIEFYKTIGTNTRIIDGMVKDKFRIISRNNNKSSNYSITILPFLIPFFVSTFIK
jgi:hypothetical protein